MESIAAWLAAIQIRDWVAAITGAVSVLSLLLNWQTRRDVAKRQAKESDRMWSVEFGHHDDAPPFYLMRLEYRDPVLNPIVVENIRGLKPRGIRLGQFNYNREYTGETRDNQPSVINIGPIIDFDVSMTGQVPGRGQFDKAWLNFYVALPSRPLLSRRDQSKSVIKLTVSDMSRSRRTRTIKVTTPPMIWADKTDNSTTGNQSTDGFLD